MKAYSKFIACLIGMLITASAFAQKDASTPVQVTPRYNEVSLDTAVRGRGHIVSSIFNRTDAVQLYVNGDSVAGTEWDKRSRYIGFEELKKLGYRPGEYETFQKAIVAASLVDVEVVPIEGEYRLWVHINVYANDRITFQGNANVDIKEDGENLVAAISKPYLYISDENITVVGSSYDWVLTSHDSNQRWFSVSRDGSFNANIEDFDVGTLIAHSRGQKGDSAEHAVSVQLGQSNPKFISGKLIDLLLGATVSSEFAVVSADLKLPDISFWRDSRWEGDWEGQLYGKYPVLVYTPVKTGAVTLAIAARIYTPSGDKDSLIPVSIDVIDVRSGGVKTYSPNEDGTVEFQFEESSYQIIPHFDGVKVSSKG